MADAAFVSMMSFSVPPTATSKKRPLSPPLQQSPPLWHHPIATNNGARLSPTLAFKRLRVSEPATAAQPSLSSLQPQEQPQCMRNLENDYGEKQPNQGHDGGGGTSWLMRAGTMQEHEVSNMNNDDDFNYQPVNHLLGDLHRQRMLRHERETLPPPRNASFAPHLCDGNLSTPNMKQHHSATYNNPRNDMSFEYQTPPSATATTRRNRRQLKLYTDSKLG